MTISGISSVSGEQSIATDTSPTASLVRAAAAGDKDAWEQLVEQFGNLVWAVARSHRLNSADAADVSQTTWLRLLDHLDDIRQPERVGAWLATTARRESLRVIRMGRREVTMADEPIVDLDTVHHHDLASDLLEQERNAALWKAFEGLTPRCRLLLPLLMGENPLSYRDLSEALEMPIGSIGPTRQRCLDHLRSIVAGISVLHDALDDEPTVVAGTPSL